MLKTALSLFGTVFLVSGCDLESESQVTAGAVETLELYETNKIGVKRSCLRFRELVCWSSEFALPDYVKTSDPDWSGLYSQITEGGRRRCSREIPGGVLVSEKLEFLCREPKGGEMELHVPKQVAGKVVDISEMVASIRVCQESEDYKGLTSEDRERLRHDIERLVEEVQRLSQIHSADILYSSFELRQNALVNNSDFRALFNTDEGSCVYPLHDSALRFVEKMTREN